MNGAAPKLRAALVLGRVSNLPTVWSNLLAGWILARGGQDFIVLGALLAGGSSLYVGGMYLNDFCDAGFDAVYRPERPIPAGVISRRAVGCLAAGWLGIGAALLALPGWRTGALGLVLLAVIVFYDVLHKKIAWAPLLMGLCRCLLYLIAASASAAAIPGRVIFAGLLLGCYVAGITYLARGESRPQGRAGWPLVLLLLPCANAGVNPSGSGVALSALSSLLLLGWMGWLLIPLWRGINPSVGRAVGGLLAGIVLVDLLAVAPVLGFDAGGFLIFFGLALLLQRSIPAT